MISFPAKLYHPYLKGSSKVVAIIHSDHIEFKNDHLEKIVNSGMPIPYYIKEKFENKKVVRLEDALCVSAFIQVYFPFYLKTQGYQLRDSQNLIVTVDLPKKEDDDTKEESPQSMWKKL